MKMNEREVDTRLVFVVGNSRSGTTMMAHILGRHPSIFTFNELHFFEQLWSLEDQRRYLSRAEAEQLVARLLSIQRDGYLNQRDSSGLREEAQGMVSTIRAVESMSPARIFELFLRSEALKNSKIIPCDHTPRNVFYLGQILELYPEVRIINVVRDPRDVLLSQKRKWKRRFLGDKGTPLKETLRSWVNYHPTVISKLWISSVRAAESFIGDDRVRFLRFEDVLADPEEEIRGVCEFVGIDFDKSMLEVPQVGSSNIPDHPERKGISQERAGSWRRGGLDPEEIFLCQKITRELMNRHSYESTPVRPELLRLFYNTVLFPVKLGLAIYFNLSRMRRSREAILIRLRWLLK